MGCANVLSCKRAEVDESSGCVNKRALTRVRQTTTGRAVQRAGNYAETQDELLFA